MNYVGIAIIVLKVIILLGIIISGFFKQMFYPRKEMPKNLRYNVHEIFKICVSSYAAIELVKMFV